MTETPCFKFKVHYGSEVRRFRSDLENFHEVTDIILDWFHIEHSQKESYQLKIKDEEGDLVSISTREDLENIGNWDGNCVLLDLVDTSDFDQVIKLYLMKRGVSAAIEQQREITEDSAMMSILRDISLYIAGRDLSQVKSWVSSEKSLITPQLAKRIMHSRQSTDYLKKKPNAQKKSLESPASNIQSPTRTNETSDLSNCYSIGGWTTEKVTEWLEANAFHDLVSLFKDNDITGDVLLDLDQDTLKDMGIKSVGKRIKLLRAINELTLEE